MKLYTWSITTSTQKHSVFIAPDAHLHKLLSYTSLNILQQIRQRQRENYGLKEETVASPGACDRKVANKIRTRTPARSRNPTKSGEQLMWRQQGPENAQNVKAPEGRCCPNLDLLISARTLSCEEKSATLQTRLYRALERD